MPSSGEYAPLDTDYDPETGIEEEEEGGERSATMTAVAIVVVMAKPKVHPLNMLAPSKASLKRASNSNSSSGAEVRPPSSISSSLDSLYAGQHPTLTVSTIPGSTQLEC